MKKAIIIGGGIAGLSAGFFLQLYGFESEIFETQSVVGGECTGWERSDFHIDNCIHWLTGTKKDTEMYKLWEQLGALGDDVKIISPEIFYTSHIGNTSVSLYRNREKTRKELLDISPSDKDEINSFINSVKACECIQIPCDMPMDMMSKMQMMKLGMSMVGALKPIKKYGQITIDEFAKKFKSPILRTFFSDYIDKEYSAISLIMSYASFSSGNADIPAGGSLKFSQRIAEKYKSMGGKIHTSSPVKSINIKNTAATGITLKNGETIEADYVISCCDAKITFGKLLDEKYMPTELEKNYKNLPVRSAFQVAFGVSDECKFIKFI